MTTLNVTVLDQKSIVELYDQWGNLIDRVDGPRIVKFGEDPNQNDILDEVEIGEIFEYFIKHVELFEEGVTIEELFQRFLYKKLIESITVDELFVLDHINRRLFSEEVVLDEIFSVTKTGQTFWREYVELRELFYLTKNAQGWTEAVDVEDLFNMKTTKDGFVESGISLGEEFQPKVIKAPLVESITLGELFSNFNISKSYEESMTLNEVFEKSKIVNPKEWDESLSLSESFIKSKTAVRGWTEPGLRAQEKFKKTTRKTVGVESISMGETAVIPSRIAHHGIVIDDFERDGTFDKNSFTDYPMYQTDKDNYYAVGNKNWRRVSSRPVWQPTFNGDWSPSHGIYLEDTVGGNGEHMFIPFGYDSVRADEALFFKVALQWGSGGPTVNIDLIEDGSTYDGSYDFNGYSIALFNDGTLTLQRERDVLTAVFIDSETIGDAGTVKSRVVNGYILPGGGVGASVDDTYTVSGSDLNIDPIDKMGITVRSHSGTQGVYFSWVQVYGNFA